MMYADAEDSANSEDESKKICIVGRDMTEFSVLRFGSFIQRIDLSFNLLTKVKGLYVCAENLEELILDNNQLELIDLKTTFPKLHSLSLNKNRIWDLSSLLKELATRAFNLRYLSLLGNPVCPDQLTNDFASESDYQKYRWLILFHLRSLRFLDHRIVSPKELRRAENMTLNEITLAPSFTPLPISFELIKARAAESRKSCASEKVPKTGKQGKRRFKYVGKNSEGNRFIKDSDL